MATAPLTITNLRQRTLLEFEELVKTNLIRIVIREMEKTFHLCFTNSGSHFESKYSRMDQVKFVEDCLLKNILCTVYTQLTFTYSKSAIETLEKGVKYVQS